MYLKRYFQTIQGMKRLLMQRPLLGTNDQTSSKTSYHS
jgi:hypothetical protein